MRPGFWKKLSSYFVERPIESASSEWNPELHVCLSKGRYQLCTAGAIYSYEDLYANFFLAFAVLQSGYGKVFPKGAQKDDAGRLYSLGLGRKPLLLAPVLKGGEDVLILGLGLGSVLWMLERNFGLRLHYTAVEIDPEVIYLAEKYALSDLHSPCELIQTDARLFVRQDSRQYDLVIMDVFRDARIPEPFRQLDFLEDLEQRLSPNATLLFNFLAQTEEDRRRADVFFREKFLEVFPQGDYLDTGGNWMMCNRQMLLFLQDDSRTEPAGEKTI